MKKFFLVFTILILVLILLLLGIGKFLNREEHSKSENEINTLLPLYSENYTSKSESRASVTIQLINHFKF